MRRPGVAAAPPEPPRTMCGSGRPYRAPSGVAAVSRGWRRGLWSGRPATARLRPSGFRCARGSRSQQAPQVADAPVAGARRWQPGATPSLFYTSEGSSPHSVSSLSWSRDARRAKEISSPRSGRNPNSPGRQSGVRGDDTIPSPRRGRHNFRTACSVRRGARRVASPLCPRTPVRGQGGVVPRGDSGFSGLSATPDYRPGLLRCRRLRRLNGGCRRTCEPLELPGRGATAPRYRAERGKSRTDAH